VNRIVVIVVAVSAAGVASIALLAAGARQNSPAMARSEVSAQNDLAIRGCRTRGEPSARPSPNDVVLGATRSHLDGFASSKPSLFSSRADQVGFNRYIDGPRGRALPADKRERLRRLARHYYSQLKTGISVAAGRTVTLAIARADRPYAAFFFGHERGHQIGPYYSYRVSGGTARLRLMACRRDEPRFSAPGPVGPLTSFPGAFLVAGARCITVEVHERGRPVRKRQLRFGVTSCRPRS
jgi:hypothetical protein